MGYSEGLALPSDVYQYIPIITHNSKKSYIWGKQHIEENCHCLKI